MEDPLHSILDTPREYDIVQLLLRIGDVSEPFIDFTLAKAQVRRRLRFVGPRVLQLGEAFEKAPRGLEIRDISARQIGGLKLYIEGAEGALSFWAKAVMERPLDEREPALRARRLRTGSELEQILERYDPRLMHKLEWLKGQGKREPPPVRAYRETPARTTGSAARYFVISTSGYCPTVK